MAVRQDIDGAGDGQSRVLSAQLCMALEEWLTPMPYDAYNITKCNWKAQQVRPFLLRTPGPQACAVGESRAL